MTFLSSTTRAASGFVTEAAGISDDGQPMLEPHSTFRTISRPNRPRLELREQVGRVANQFHIRLATFSKYY
jgi:hypothetical protein